MLNLSTGLTALQSNQVALDVIAQNIANANTPGYHRQVAQLVERAPVELNGLFIGTGVDVSEIRQIRSGIIEEALTRNISQRADAGTQLDAMRQIESLLTPGSGSIHDRFQTFFDNLQQLSTRPNDSTLRRIVLQSAAALTSEINSLSDGYLRFRSQLDSEIEQTVDQINGYTAKIAQLNRTIQIASSQGSVPNDLLDQRDELVNRLAELVGVNATQEGGQRVTINLVDGGVLATDSPVPLQVLYSQSGQAEVAIQGFTDPITFHGGKLAGLLEARNQILPDYQQRLSTLANGLIRSIDAVQATGLGSGGSFQRLDGARSVNNVAVPLSNSGMALPASAGDLFVSVTDASTGNRTISRVTIDPATQSLQDVAAAISAIDHVQAVVNSQTKTLTILAEPGYAFDFAGRLETSLDVSSFTGTSSPGLSGRYSGTANEEFQFQVVGTGTVGVTPGLTVEVRNSAGQLINSLNVGAGYEPGSALSVADGVSVSFSSGTANSGDSLTSPMVALPDTSGLLVGLGLNSFFQGTTAGDIRVNPRLLQDPSLFATSRTGQPGDVGNLQGLLALRDSKVLANGTQTFEQYLNDMTVRIGSQVSEQTLITENLDLLGSRLEADRISFSGVDPNEEVVNMIQYQRSFQAAAQYLSTVNEMLDDLFQILK
ncbi:MAG: flagellar hook-associated protein FlgK [Planctomycetaceae bacterium]